MENATKALLIAAAILIAILIISLALVVYNMASETVGKANLSEAEMAQFNGKFTAYEGSNVTGAQVNALLNTVLTSNLNASQEGSGNYVQVVSGTAGGASLATSATSITRVPTSAYYTVTTERGSNGLINKVTVTKN